MLHEIMGVFHEAKRDPMVKPTLSILMTSLLLTGCIATNQAKNDTTAPEAQSTAKAEPASAPSATQTQKSEVTCKDEPAPVSKPAKGKANSRTSKTAKTSQPAPATAPCPAAANASQAAEKASAAAPGASSGRREVKGINDWTGYIEGEPAPGSKFNRLQIGMSNKQVTDLIGPPTDQQAHITGKAWIPFYYGAGKHEMLFYYKGMGRLLFAGGAGYSTGVSLIGIEHDAKEGGYAR